jgi:8-oxo-dGTP diphosphatase
VVAAAMFDAHGRVLLADRPVGKHMAGWWEFPGGKVAVGESDADALVRELREELGIEARADRFIFSVTHEYPDREVEIVLWQATILRGEPRGLDGQNLKWVYTYDLAAERLLEADRPFIDALQLLSSPANH